MVESARRTSFFTPFSYGSFLMALGLALGVLGGVIAALALRAGMRSDSWDAPSPLGGLLLIVAGAVAVLLGHWLRSRHLVVARLTPATFLTPGEEARVLDAIRRFENRTSGEIRVHLAGYVRGDVLDAARRAFEELGMTATAERNGVLFFVATHSRRFAVVGDAGIDARVPDGFWDEIVNRVREAFAAGRFGEGLVAGIERAGEKLAEHFPRRPDDVNELPDQISRDGAPDGPRGFPR